MTEDKMVGSYHQLNRHEFEQTLGENGGQRSLVCCSPGDHKESDMTQQMKTNNSLEEVTKKHQYSILTHIYGIQKDGNNDPICETAKGTQMYGSLLDSNDFMGFPESPLVKNPPAVQETWVPSLGCEDLLKKGKATHSSILAWRIP